MSKHYELLQQRGKDRLLRTSGSPLPPAPNVADSVPTGTFVDDDIARLVQRLFFLGNANRPKVVSFSGVSREGRGSWICARVAQALSSQTPRSVCVVDADLSSRSLHTHFGVGNLGGLADALATSGPVRGFARPLSRHNLWLISAGSLQGNLYRQAERFRACLTELSTEFPYVLISAPPLIRQTEATLAGQLADGIVLIVEANQTRRDAVRRAKEHLEAAQVQLLGAVLDQRTFPIPDFLYRRL
jgi:succinoglycan biosynthesis transport protein ExoP